jgi:hypothetical protein
LAASTAASRTTPTRPALQSIDQRCDIERRRRPGICLDGRRFDRRLQRIGGIEQESEVRGFERLLPRAHAREQRLHRVRQRRDRIVPHHRTHSLDSMNRPEELVHRLASAHRGRWRLLEGDQ